MFDKACRVCGKEFKTNINKCQICSDTCRRKRKAEYVANQNTQRKSGIIPPAKKEFSQAEKSKMLQIAYQTKVGKPIRVKTLKKCACGNRLTTSRDVECPGCYSLSLKGHGSREYTNAFIDIPSKKSGI